MSQTDHLDAVTARYDRLRAPAEVTRAFAEARRVLRPGGRLLITTSESEEGVARAVRELPETVEYDLELLIVVATR